MTLTHSAQLQGKAGPQAVGALLILLCPAPVGGLYWLSMKALNLSFYSIAQSLPSVAAIVKLLEKYESYGFCEKGQ